MTTIYKITHNHQIIYIGKTTQDLSTRFKQHLNDKKHVDKSIFLNTNSCNIEIIKICEDHEATYFEQLYITKHLPRFNQILASKNNEIKIKIATKNAKKIIKNLNNEK
jgi:excinuclease UvrABC nuclease subunit